MTATSGTAVGLQQPALAASTPGRLADWLSGGAIDAPFYVVVLVADDPAEIDGNPLVDGPGPGFGVLTMRAEAFGPVAPTRSWSRPWPG